MKLTKLFLGMCVFASLAACSSDDEMDIQNSIANKDQAYVTISLYNAGETTRGSDGGFTNGNATEGTVSDVEFYFYNANGTYNQYVAKENITWAAQTDGGNVEQIATNATIVLENLKEKGKPAYVVAILNGEQKAYQNLSLSELKTQLVEDYKTTNFIMTNSTYNNGDATSEYFATKIVDANFLAEKPTQEQLTSANAVQIYVERVAVKAELKINNAKYANNQYTIGSFEVDGVETEIKLDILGWGLNAINKTSYVEKNVDETFTALGTFDWDDAANYRSYWAHSTNYGNQDAVYPLSYGKEENGVQTLETITPANAALKYVSWTNLTKGMGSPDYCLENTNTKALLETGNFKAKATHALLKAQISDKQDLVRYDGRLFTKSNFINRVANQLAVYKVRTNGADTTYTLVEPTDLEVVDIHDGNVTLGLTATAEALTWSSTKETTTPITASAIEDTLKELVDAEYYKDGMMYYCIPIEHLRGGKVTYNEDLTIEVEEGDYGVVRNHYYQITISDITDLGTSVYNADEAIVPNMETPTYYVGAQINILAWKIVTQSVVL